VPPRQQRPRAAGSTCRWKNSRLVRLAAPERDGYKALPPAFVPWDDRGYARSPRLVAPSPRRSTTAAPVGA
jgi:hypothetical protein